MQTNLTVDVPATLMATALPVPPYISSPKMELPMCFACTLQEEEELMPRLPPKSLHAQLCDYDWTHVKQQVPTIQRRSEGNADLLPRGHNGLCSFAGGSMS